MTRVDWVRVSQESSWQLSHLFLSAIWLDLYEWLVTRLGLTTVIPVEGLSNMSSPNRTGQTRPEPKTNFEENVNREPNEVNLAKPKPNRS